MLLTPLAPLGQQRVACDTTAGPFTVLLNESLSPLGVMRVTDLVKSGFMEGQLLYRVIPGLLVRRLCNRQRLLHSSLQLGPLPIHQIPGPTLSYP